VKVAICGGGTGGHLHPLLALAEELASHKGVEVTLFLSRKAPSSGTPRGERIILLETSGFSRNLDAANIKAAVEMARAFFICRREMKEWPPQVVVAFGGYASMPGAAAALSLRVPLVIHEQNVIPGLANRILAPGARRLAVSFEDTLEGRPRWRRKAVVTGNPLIKPPRRREDENPWAYFGLEEARKTLAVVGGSQGASSLNRAVLEALPLWRDREDLQVVHGVGRDKYQDYMAQVAKVGSGGMLYRPLDFIERMDLLYRVADLVVCRSGASTVTELAMAGCAAILVPYPYATVAHQDANAAVFQKAGAALVVKDSQLDGPRLHMEVDRLLSDPGKLNEMRISSLKEARPDAASQLSDLVLSLAKEA
jgi:UDP-N-acetylglucosamine--N-acetylmuramyl-(pentapeptide) pyrophosphoryl-undecaprenol N-acetylglucosamine transferase